MTLTVDAHLHVFDRADRSSRGVSELVPVERDAPAKRILGRMALANVDHAVLVALDEHDDTLRQAVSEHPDAFATVIVSGPDEQGRSGADPIASLEVRRDGLGYRGVRTMWLGEPNRPLADSPAMPMLRYLQSHGLVLWSYLPPEQTPHLRELGTAFPDLIVVLNHFGFAPHDMRVDAHGRPRFTDPFPDEDVERVRALASFRSFHLLFSGQYALSSEPYPYEDLVPISRVLVDAFGADRTMWGSDWPWIDQHPGYARTLSLIDLALPDASAAERAAIRGGTAARIMSFPINS